MCFSAPWNFVSPELKLWRLSDVINSQKICDFKRTTSGKCWRKKFHWFVRRLGVKHQLIADGKNINIKEKWGEKRSLHWGSRFSLLFIANIYYISYDANNSKSHPCWNSSSSCHEGIKETQRDRDRKKYVLCAIPLFPYKIKTKT